MNERINAFLAEKEEEKKKERNYNLISWGFFTANNIAEADEVTDEQYNKLKNYYDNLNNAEIAENEDGLHNWAVFLVVLAVIEIIGGVILAFSFEFETGIIIFISSILLALSTFVTSSFLKTISKISSRIAKIEGKLK